jgi:hypothetical protein
MFNAVGYTTTNGGLNGLRSTSVLLPSRTVLFVDNVVMFPANPTGWHRCNPAGNVLLVDSHAEFHTALSVTHIVW